VNRYGLYDAATFADVAKTHSFGFSIRYAGPGGFDHYGYYGAWQGRHSIWLDGQQGLPAGATVTRGDRDPSLAPVSYTASPVFSGVLVKRTAVATTLLAIQDVVLQGNDQVSFSLSKDAQGAWTSCVNPHWDMQAQPPQQVCDASASFTDFASLSTSPGDRRFVNVNTWDQAQMRPVQLAWVAGAFHEVDASGAPTATVYPVPAGEQLWVNLNGPIFVFWDGSGWQKKAVESWPQNQPMPTFAAGGDAPYTGFQIGRDAYLNDRGTNYLLTRTAGGYGLKVERQVAANPVTAPSFLPDGTVLRRQWDLARASDYTSFRFDGDPASPTYMQLVCASVSAGCWCRGGAVRRGR